MAKKTEEKVLANIVELEDENSFMVKVSKTPEWKKIPTQTHFIKKANMEVVFTKGWDPGRFYATLSKLNLTLRKQYYGCWAVVIGGAIV